MFSISRRDNAICDNSCIHFEKKSLYLNCSLQSRLPEKTRLWRATKICLYLHSFKTGFRRKLGFASNFNDIWLVKPDYRRSSGSKIRCWGVCTYLRSKNFFSKSSANTVISSNHGIDRRFRKQGKTKMDSFQVKRLRVCGQRAEWCTKSDAQVTLRNKRHHTSSFSAEIIVVTSTSCDEYLLVQLTINLYSGLTPMSPFLKPSGNVLPVRP